jgi:hypothetical protein
MEELKEQEGREAWVIGNVEKGNRRAKLLLQDLKMAEVPVKDTEGQLW